MREKGQHDDRTEYDDDGQPPPGEEIPRIGRAHRRMAHREAKDRRERRRHDGQEVGAHQHGNCREKDENAPDHALTPGGIRHRGEKDNEEKIPSAREERAQSPHERHRLRALTPFYHDPYFSFLSNDFPHAPQIVLVLFVDFSAYCHISINVLSIFRESNPQPTCHLAKRH